MKTVDSYRALVAAMAERAVIDDRRATRRLEAAPDDVAAKATAEEAEVFLESDWVRELLYLSEIHIPRGGWKEAA